jgi:SAM-dependent methyltransferase
MAAANPLSDAPPAPMTQAFWDQRYADSSYLYGERVNDFLAAHAPYLRPGQRALALGDGEGRNGVWLAEQGLEVTAVDHSPRGLAKARALAERRGVPLETIEQDLLQWAWPVAEFDLVVLVYLHLLPTDRAMIHPAAAQALRPGGLLVLEAFHPRHVHRSTGGGPPRGDVMYDEATLAADFRALHPEQLETCVVDLDEGTGHRGPADVVRLRARRPEASAN